MNRICALVTGLLMLLVVAAPAQAASAGKAKSGPQYLVSLGDSYAVGYQDAVRQATANGPANQLLPLATKRGYHFKLVNFGCGGATTTSMLEQVGCPAPAQALAPWAVPYPSQTQTQAAVAFIERHRGHVGLVTVSIGGNDIDTCISAPDPLQCVMTNMVKAKANLTKIVKQLRAAGGRQLRIVGSTYPDVVLGAWVRSNTFGANAVSLAVSSLTSFAKYINPGLKEAYHSAGAAFVDVTAATGAYGPFVTTDDPIYGEIPVPVATVCRLTYFCTQLGIHMTTPGYHIIAQLEAATLPKLK